jgi:hypothetical protein
MRINSISVFCDEGNLPKIDIRCNGYKDIVVDIHLRDELDSIVTCPSIAIFLDSIYDLIQFRDSINYSINKAIKDFSNESS